jgi:hypothetical protein
MEHRLTAVNGTKDPVPGVLYQLKSERALARRETWRSMNKGRQPHGFAPGDDAHKRNHRIEVTCGFR